MTPYPSPTSCFIEPLEARIAPAFVNLGVTIDSMKLPNVAVPGDTGSITYTVTNHGDDHFSSRTLCVNLWLTKDTSPVPLNQDIVYLATHQKFLDGEPNIVMKLAPSGSHGDSVTRTVKFNLPDLMLGAAINPNFVFGSSTAYNLGPGTGYHIVVEVDGAFLVDPFFHDNNSAASPAFEWAYKFGAVGTRKDVILHGTEIDGTTADFDLSGPGTGTVQLVNNLGVGGHFVNLSFAGTGATSFASAGIFKSRTSDDHITLNSIASISPLGQLKMAHAFVLNGDVDLAPGIQLLQLGDLTGLGNEVSIGSAAKPATVILGQVKNFGLTATGGIASLTALDWTETGVAVAKNTITAPFITKFSATGKKTASIAGDVMVNLALSGVDARGQALGVARIHGALRDCEWTVTGTGKIDDIITDEIANWKLDAETSSVASLYSAHDLINTPLASLKAHDFGIITVAGRLTTALSIGGVDATGSSLDKLSASSVVATTLIAAGTIGTLDLGEWLGGGTIIAQRVGILVTDGLFGTTGDFTAQFDLVGSGSSSLATLGRVKIAGALSDPTSRATGSWHIDGKIGSLIAGSIASSFSIDNPDAAPAQTIRPSLGSLKVAGNLDGRIKLDHIDTASVGGTFTGSLKANANAGDFVKTITSLKFGVVSGGVLQTDALIKVITAVNWDGGNLNISAGGIGSFKLTGGTAQHLPGFFKNSGITITGNFPESLNLLSVDAEMSNVILTLPHGAKQILVESLSGSTINAAGATIAKIVVSGVRGSTTPAFTATNISAGTITALSLANVDPVASAYGITADKVGGYVRYDNGRLLRNLRSLDAPGTPDIVGNYKLTIT